MADINYSMGGNPLDIALRELAAMSPYSKGKAASSGVEKLREKKTAPVQVIEPLKKPTYKTPTKSALQPVDQPSLQDYIKEAQKLGTEKFQAQAALLGQDTERVASEFASKLYGTNVGATSGVGQQLTRDVIEQQQKRLDPYARQTAVELGQTELDYRYKEAGDLQNRREQMYDQVLAGTLDKSQLSVEDWASVGVTDPDAVKTLADVDWDQAIRADGGDPNNPDDRLAFRTQLKNQKTEELRNSIIKQYAELNEGQIISPDDLEMAMYLYGGGTGILTPEEEQAIIDKYNDEQWERALKRAERDNPPEGKVLCTELYRQGLLSKDIYASDELAGLYYATYYPEVVRGYHSWGKPLARAMSNSKILTYVLKPFITAWATQMHYEVTQEGKPSMLGKAMQGIGIPICKYLGTQKGVLSWV